MRTSRLEESEYTCSSNSLVNSELFPPHFRNRTPRPSRLGQTNSQEQAERESRLISEIEIERRLSARRSTTLKLIGKSDKERRLINLRIASKKYGFDRQFSQALESARPSPGAPAAQTVSDYNKRLQHTKINWCNRQNLDFAKLQSCDLVLRHDVSVAGVKELIRETMQKEHFRVSEFITALCPPLLSYCDGLSPEIVSADDIVQLIAAKSTLRLRQNAVLSKTAGPERNALGIESRRLLAAFLATHYAITS